MSAEAQRKEAFERELRAFVGRDAGSCPPPDAVNEPMIRHFCAVTGDANPIYRDPAAAKSSVHGGIVAPPAMLDAWTMPPYVPPWDDADAPPAKIREVRLDQAPTHEVGDTITADAFAVGEYVDVMGTSKGRGFQGVVKRHGFSGGPGSHGNTRHRRPGSMGPGTDPSRVIKGKKLPGQMGDTRRTIRNLRVVNIDKERNLLVIRGAVP